MLRGGGSNVRKYNTINRRVFILSVAKGIVFTGIIARLFSLQISENKKYLTLSDKNRLREWRLPPVRGEFEDYYGNVIAGNTKVYQLHVIPEQVEDFKYLMVRLKNILNLSDKVKYFLFSLICKEKSLATIPVKTTTLAAEIINILLLIVFNFLKLVSPPLIIFFSAWN